MIEKSNSTYSNFLINYLNKEFLTDFLNILVYNGSDINYEYLKKFIDSLYRDLNSEQNLAIPITNYINFLKTINQVITLKEDADYNFISNENIEEYFSSVSDRLVKTALDNIASNPIEDDITFNKLYTKIKKDINIYEQMQIIKSTTYKWDVFLNNDSQNTSAISWVKNFVDTINEANGNLTELKKIGTSDSAKSDYIIFKDKESLKDSLKNIVGYLKTSYNCFKTGYNLIDSNLSGMESGSVTIISGPSNHAKSIFMVNIFKNLVDIHEPKSDNEVFAFITLEDDYNKLFRRFISIFGNYDANVVKNMFIQISSLFQKADKRTEDKIRDVLNDITYDAIIKVTLGKKTVIIKHNDENSFSMDDATKFIDELKLRKGLEVKALFIDYIDVMVPSNMKKNNQYSTDEYLSQGQIVQEMRTVSRNYAIPVVTITQNNRSAENMSIDMNNSLIGDSYKKIRYAETIMLIRQRADLDIYDPNISKDIGTISNIPPDLTNYLVPFEVKITKAKDGGKDVGNFHIFSKMNLKIYQKLQECIDDYENCIKKSKEFNDTISILGLPDNIELIGDLETNCLI